jgi:membrane protein YdbS with pleckstrin-like domain
MYKKIDENYFKIDNPMKKNRIEDIVTPGESILWREKPKKAAYIWSKFIQMFPIAFIWMLFDGFAIAAIFAADIDASNSGDMPVPLWLILVVFFALHLFPVWIWIGGIIKGFVEIKNIEYAFTDRRIIIREGIVGINFQSIYYSDVTSVNLKVGVMDRILHVGDIYISSSETPAVLFDVKNPYEISSKLQKITLDIKTDVNYPNALRPDVNP